MLNKKENLGRGVAPRSPFEKIVEINELH